MPEGERELENRAEGDDVERVTASNATECRPSSIRPACQAHSPLDDAAAPTDQTIFCAAAFSMPQLQGEFG